MFRVAIAAGIRFNSCRDQASGQIAHGDGRKTVVEILGSLWTAWDFKVKVV